MTYLRAHPLPAADTPLADRFHALVEEGEALASEMDRALREHRANMIARYGLPADHFTKGPEMQAFNHHRRFTEARETFNRESHSDALREMQLTERTTYDGLEVRPIVGTGTRWLPAMSMLLGLVLTVVWSVS